VNLEIRELSTDAEISDAYPLARELRDRLREETFLAEVRRQQVEGYRLYGGFALGRLVALAGVRRSHTLARGEHLFVDDLVTAADARGKGYGAAMLRAMALKARAEGLSRLCLDSRDTARGFYARLGFAFRTSIPAYIEVDELLADSPRPGGAAT
jgi:GNAT superfamily N-acetyltransferase